MSLILAAHGTRRPGGVAMIGDLAAQVGRQLGRTVRLAFVDVLGPTPSEVLADVGGGPSWCPRSCRAAITSAPTCPPTSRPAGIPMSSSRQHWAPTVKSLGSWPTNC